ncbi:MAG: hypothetical protein PHQ60_16265 [Sideroxydans sp.]|nr:hypothetical protein [Sideroxydans sp.]
MKNIKRVVKIEELNNRVKVVTAHGYKRYLLYPTCPDCGCHGHNGLIKTKLGNILKLDKGESYARCKTCNSMFVVKVNDFGFEIIRRE